MNIERLVGTMTANQMRELFAHLITQLPEDELLELLDTNIEGDVRAELAARFAEEPRK